MFKTNRNDKSGTLTELDNTVYRRMTPLTKNHLTDERNAQRPSTGNRDQ